MPEMGDLNPQPPSHPVVAFTPLFAHHIYHLAAEDWYMSHLIGYLP